MRVLVTGAGGQVGRELMAVFADTEVIGVTRAEADIADRDSALQVVTSVRPDVIVNTKAYTTVDAAEADFDGALRVNALAVRHLAEGARLVGAHLVHLSTDMVFSGDLDRPYNEWDEPGPRSAYGRSKLAGEREAMNAPSWTIVRTSWVSGRHGGNMVKTVLRLAAQHETLTFVDDQQGHPTFADDLAGMIRRLAASRLPGLFHVTNQGATTWFGFARDVLTAAGLDPERVRPVSTRDLVPARPAPRPANSVLDNAGLRLSGIPLLPDHREPLQRLVKELIA